MPAITIERFKAELLVNYEGRGCALFDGAANYAGSP